MKAGLIGVITTAAIVCFTSTVSASSCPFEFEREDVFLAHIGLGELKCRVLEAQVEDSCWVSANCHPNKEGKLTGRNAPKDMYFNLSTALYVIPSKR